MLAAMTGRGIETEETEETEEIELIEATEVTEACQGGMHDATMMTDHHEGIETCSKVEEIVAEGADEAGGVIAMSLRCRWEGETEKRARAPHQRRKSLPQI